MPEHLEDTLKLYNARQFSVVQIPDQLNPFLEDGVSIYAGLAYELPEQNIKYLTVQGMLLDAQRTGKLRGKHTLVEATSANTGLGLAKYARDYGIQQVVLIVREDVPQGKRAPLSIAGARVLPPNEDMSGRATAEEMAQRMGWLHLDQYASEANVHIHYLVTGPIIHAAVPNISLFCAGVGTGGTVRGVERFLRERNPHNLTVLGVILEDGEELPGVRDKKQLEDVPLMNDHTLDAIVTMAAKPSYVSATWLMRAAKIDSGPTGGFGYAGLLKFIKREKDAGRLDKLRNKDGEIAAAFMVPDTFRPYPDRFMTLLHGSYFQKNLPYPWELLWDHGGAGKL